MQLITWWHNTDTWNSIVHGRYIDTSECVSKCERNLCISLFWKRHNTGLCLNKNSDVFVHNCLLYFHGRKKKVVCKWQWNPKAGPMQRSGCLPCDWDDSLHTQPRMSVYLNFGLLNSNGGLPLDMKLSDKNKNKITYCETISWYLKQPTQWPQLTRFIPQFGSDTLHHFVFS